MEQVYSGICEIALLYYVVHISVLNGSLWDMEQVYSGICEIALLYYVVHISVLNGALWDMEQLSCILGFVKLIYSSMFEMVVISGLDTGKLPTNNA